MHWYLEVLKKYAVFSGRARRTEYWLFILFNTVIVLVLHLIDRGAGLANIATTGYGPLELLYVFAVLIPGLAVSSRRLHDTDHSGWWFLIVFVPLIGVIVFVIFMARESQHGPNRYGPSPMEVAARQT